MDLCGVNFSKANLYKADLFKANLFEANLSGANLNKANLYEANFFQANLSGVKGVNVLSFDERGYRLICWKKGRRSYFNAGCRNFTYKEAIAHWGSEDYHHKELGEEYVRAVKILCKK